MSDITHLLITRFGVGVSYDEWFVERIPLFLNFSYRSLRAQTRQDFSWVVMTDIRVPEWVKAFFALIEQETPLLQVRYVDPLQTLTMTPISKQFISTYVPSEHALLSRLDYDDCWARDYAENLRCFDAFYQGCHKPGLLVTSPFGAVFSIAERKANLEYYPLKSTSVDIYSPAKNLLHPYASSHTKMKVKALERNFVAVDYQTTSPAWLNLRHDGQASNVQRSSSELALMENRRMEDIPIPALKQWVDFDESLPLEERYRKLIPQRYVTKAELPALDQTPAWQAILDKAFEGKRVLSRELFNIEVKMSLLSLLKESRNKPKEEYEGLLRQVEAMLYSVP